jgi:hypothetical protein
VFFAADNFALTVAQAACVAAPAAGLPRWAQRFRGSWWALIVPGSIAAVIGGIELAPGTADVLTWVALLLVPFGAAVCFGWAMRGARPWLALLAAPLLAVAWASQDTRAGQVATILLIAGSAVAAGRLLAGAAPLILLKAGVVAMAAIDSILVFTENLQPANAVLVAASPGLGLPRLQSAGFGDWGLGYGDFFAAAVVGAIFAVEGRRQSVGALATIVAALAWDQLFLVQDTLPATVPAALVLLAFEAVSVARRR